MYYGIILSMNLSYLNIVNTIIVLTLASGGGYYIYDLTNTLEQREQELTKIHNNLATTSQALTQAHEANQNLRGNLEEKEEELDMLITQVKNITGEISTIEKRQKLDEELLKKYSRVYFLNENYWPSDLKRIPNRWVADTKKEDQNEDEHIHDQVWSFLKDMLEDAKDDDIDLRILSAFRSFEEQQDLKSRYDVLFGKGTANEFSASQGYSEHQLGTAIDFTTPDLNANFEQFDTTKAYKWLLDNAHKYGFVLSYPENNTFYQFEPWHWRFVGVELAEDLEQKNMNFYDMEQRKIDEYLINIFED